MSATAALRFVETLQAASPVRRNTYCQELIRLITSSNDVVELEPGDVVSYVATLDQTMAIPREGRRAMRKIPFNLVALLACGLTALSSPQALSQGSTKVWKVGILWHEANLPEEQIMFGPISEGMRDLGYVEGRNVVYDHTFVDENYSRFEARAQELIDHKVDLILASVAYRSYLQRAAIP